MDLSQEGLLGVLEDEVRLGATLETLPPELAWLIHGATQTFVPCLIMHGAEYRMTPGIVTTSSSVTGCPGDVHGRAVSAAYSGDRCMESASLTGFCTFNGPGGASSSWGTSRGLMMLGSWTWS
jgi:hypothetical protein